MHRKEIPTFVSLFAELLTLLCCVLHSLLDADGYLPSFCVSEEPCSLFWPYWAVYFCQYNLIRCCLSVLYETLWCAIWGYPVMWYLHNVPLQWKLLVSSSQHIVIDTQKYVLFGQVLRKMWKYYKILWLDDNWQGISSEVFKSEMLIQTCI